MKWRERLFVGIGCVYVLGEGWMVLRAAPPLRNSILVLTTVFVLAMLAVFRYYRSRLTSALFTSNVALGALIHLALTGLIVLADRLTTLGVLPAIENNLVHFIVGGLGIGAAFFSWTRARAPTDSVATRVDPVVEPPPIQTSSTESEIAWQRTFDRLDGDPIRLQTAVVLQRIFAALDEPDAARRVIAQELGRLEADAVAATDEPDRLTQTAALLEWGFQKLPELAELEVSDLLMAKAIADIHSAADKVERQFVDHRKLLAIHPINRQTADDKCNERAQAARDARGLLEANGMRMSEQMTAVEPALKAFQSVTGFQVFELSDGRYVTFEGNGRREAIARAYGDEPVSVEVRNYIVHDKKKRDTLERRIQRVRRWKNEPME